MIKSLKISKKLEDYIAEHSYELNPVQKEIINHRKNKFLSIGRSKGFVSNKNTSENLVMKMNLRNQFELQLHQILEV